MGTGMSPSLEREFNRLYESEGHRTGTWVNRELAKFWFLVGKGKESAKPKKKVSIPHKESKYNNVPQTSITKEQWNALTFIQHSEIIIDELRSNNWSERELAARHSISKSEIHRLVIIGRLSDEIRRAATTNKIEKYVLLEWSDLLETPFKKKLLEMILKGELRKRWQLKQLIAQKGK